MRHPLSTMGNVCSSNNNNKVGGRPPRDLTGLVEDILVSNSGDQTSIWEEHFRQFLRHRGQKDLEHALDFVTLSTKLESVQEETRNVKTKKTKEDLKQDKVALLNQMGSRYFTRETEASIPLSNQVLREELSETLARVSLKSSEAEVEEACSLVSVARTDHKIWKAGLDASYKTFLANKPSPTVKAVLLSIL